jgi:hypothetical protein
MNMQIGWTAPPLPSFQVRLRSREGFAAITARTGQALNLEFTPWADRMFSPGEAVSASAFGLNVILSHNPAIPEGEQRTYVLSGAVTDELEVNWPLDAPTQSLSAYVLALLHLTDSLDWYIASMAELREEAGLD